MPNGTIAPGNVLPPPLVQVRVSTRAATSLIGWPTGLVLRAPAGRWLLATGFAQLVSRPLGATTQVVGVRLPCRALDPVVGAWGLPLGDDGLDDGLDGGLDGAAPAVPATAAPRPSRAAVSAATVAIRRVGRCEPAAVMASSCARRSGPSGPV